MSTNALKIYHLTIGLCCSASAVPPPNLHRLQWTCESPKGINEEEKRRPKCSSHKKYVNSRRRQNCFKKCKPSFHTTSNILIYHCPHAQSGMILFV